jgi:hypothetical protein
VFPVKGKAPLVGQGGLHLATAEMAQLLNWHNRWPSAGWAVTCGDRLAVVDVDVKHGADVEAVLSVVAGPTVLTGKHDGERGVHVYCTGPARTAPRTSLKGVEIRGKGAYVVLPGSPHESGVAYEWAGDRRPWREGDMAPLPDALRPVERLPVASAGSTALIEQGNRNAEPRPRARLRPR